MKMEQKYTALLKEAARRSVPNLDGIQLCFQVLSLATAIDRNCASLLTPHGLSEGRFVILFLLDAAGEGLAPAVLADQAGVSRATVTGLLDGLENDALIGREADPADRRALRIRLTRKGKQVAKLVFEHHSRWIGGLFSNLSTQERALFAQMLTKVASSVGTAELPPEQRPART
ncbi:MarR family transcriptional regulator [Burkholderia sp. SRS-W-2-2016]|uniref:MarR family winged helix-turn-helix transcriptional regulator n=1 Tax=Burkholderia sp. SRS-W-2-2016 TaxID=1926878 RepID=UPI00094B5AD3|nr:MarR family transcriptional regulator [Burkholderia sp. SRS-W-2-2016]OLL27416.1 MarR family transcriptional regulator [Burkholderia sp. SRS-W-2-2016]